MPIKNARYRFGKEKNGEKIRYTFVGNKVVEVRPFYKKDGTYVPGQLRKIKPKK